jgi:hypothetical protein
MDSNSHSFELFTPKISKRIFFICGKNPLSRGVASNLLEDGVCYGADIITIIIRKWEFFY